MKLEKSSIILERKAELSAALVVEMKGAIAALGGPRSDGDTKERVNLLLHPQTAEHVAGGVGRQAAEKFSAAPSFAADTAAKTGRDERTVRLHAERGEKVIAEVIDLIQGTKLDTGTYLDKLKKMPPNDQIVAAKRDLAFIRQQETEKNRSPSASTRSNKIDADVKARAAKEVAELIAEHIPGDWWDNVKSNLFAAGASNIANELTNIIGNSVADNGRSTR